MALEANTPTDKILAEIAECCEITGLSKTALGEQALNDRALVKTLEDGRELLPRTYRRLRSFMDRKIAEKRAEAAS